MVTLRQGSESDAELLADIHKACFPNYWNPEAFNDFFSVAGTQALIAYEAGPVGMIVWRALYEDAEILTLAVLPGTRRKGVAAGLLERVMQDALSSGVNRLLLDVEDGNTAALGLYARYGFTQINRRKQYYRQKDGTFTDALVMKKKIS